MKFCALLIFTSMKTYLKSLFDYQNQANELVFSALFPQREGIGEYAYKMFSHSIMTQHVWQHRILQLPFAHAFWYILNEHELRNLMENNQNELNNILDNMELDNVIDYTSLDGIAYQSNLKDILFHVSHHSSYHRGQIAKALRDAGYEPPQTDFILFRR